MNELIGLWYKPGSDNKAEGVLRYDPTICGILDLKILGSFDNLCYSSNLTYYNDIILGECGDKKITLYKCIENRSKIKIEGGTFLTESQFYVWFIFIGKHFNEKSALKFDEFSFDFYNSEFWFNMNPNKPLNDGPTDIISHYRIFDNLEILFKIRKERGSQFHYITIVQGDSSFECLHKYFWYLLHFFSFNLMNPTYSNHVSVRSDNEFIEVWFIKPNFRFTRSLTFNDDGLMNYQDIKENLGEILNNWFKLEQDLGAILEIYFDHLYNQDYGFVHRFLNMIQIFEGLHRRIYNGEQTNLDEPEYSLMITSIFSSIQNEEYKKWLEGKLKYAIEINLATRVKRIIARFKILEEKWNEEQLKVDKFIYKTVNTRNYYTHFDKELETQILKNEELVYYSNLVKIIIDVVILSSLGFTGPQISKMITNKRFYKELSIQTF